ncbi:MAG TPA: hypothetical protein VJN96_13675 [Vicinamibacterales bacterium]|nr:hypothetical protein [Vicinamibacterales bacterium]
MTPPLANRPLHWTQARLLKQSFDLSDGDTPLGTLVFRSSLGTFATARLGNGCWTMKRLGFLRTRVEIRACESDTAVATFHNNTWSGGGTLALATGPELRANTNFWHSRFEFVDAEGQSLVRYTIGGVMKASGEMEITTAGAALPDIAWIAMLGWYLVVMMRNDSAVAAAAAG